MNYIYAVCLAVTIILLLFIPMPTGNADILKICIGGLLGLMVGGTKGAQNANNNTAGTGN
jgi:hypothetical protein